MRFSRWLITALVIAVTVSVGAAPQAPASAPAAQANPKAERSKRDVGLEVDGMREDIQRMNDQVFSFGELGFQEFETSKYLTDILEKNGFTVEREPRRHSDGVDGDVGIGQAGDRARLRHRLHPAGVAEAGRRATASRSSTARRGTARGTTPACRCRSPPRWR